MIIILRSEYIITITHVIISLDNINIKIFSVLFTHKPITYG